VSSENAHKELAFRHARSSSRWRRPTHFNGAATIVVFEMCSGLTAEAHEEKLRYGNSANRSGIGI
jgi:hypothetical protein